MGQKSMGTKEKRSRAGVNWFWEGGKALREQHTEAQGTPKGEESQIKGLAGDGDAPRRPLRAKYLNHRVVPT